MSWREQLSVGELTVQKSLTLAELGGTGGSSITSGVILGDMTTGLLMSGDMTTGMTLSGAITTGISLTGDMTDGISFANTFTGDGIDFSGITYVPTGSNGPSLTRCGTYGSPLTHAVEAQSGLMRWYMETTADGTSYDRGLFVCLKTQGTKGIFPGAFLAEVKSQTGAGPTAVMGIQSIVHANAADAVVAGTGATGGFYGGWFKITANSGATLSVGCKAAPLWVDNQLYGSNIGAGGTLATEWGIFATTGGSRPRAFVGFSTTSSGYVNLFSFDSTYSTSVSPCNGGAVNTDGGDSTGSLKMEINGTAYLIPYFAA